jgi:hypothetical protein
MRAVSRLEKLDELTMKIAAKYDEGQLAVFCSIKLAALVKLELFLQRFSFHDELVVFHLCSSSA